MGRRPVPIEIGAQYGSWTLLQEHYRATQKHRAMLCRCACGTERIVRLDALRRGSTAGCGCHVERHGQWNTPEYKTWQAMRFRCSNPSHVHFADYGGRGIKVCERWRESFSAFLEDVGPRPSRQFTLDRIDNSKGYEPGNCQWSTRKQQANNRRTNRVVVIRGVEANATEWAHAAGLPADCVGMRLRKRWSPYAAVMTPIGMPRVDDPRDSLSAA